MTKPSLSIKFAFALSLSLALSYSSPSSSFSIKRHSFPGRSKASASDLLSLLGTREQASKVYPKEAQDLMSCLKFLVPFSPSLGNSQLETCSTRRKVSSTMASFRSRREEDELIWWPPQPVLELARLAVDSGGDPAAIQRTLDPTMLNVPDIEGSKENRCELTRTPYGRRFINEELNSYLEFLFEIIVARAPTCGLDVTLSRYDLFHGHLFLSMNSGRLGILFHAKEYPAYDKDVFPLNMGYCQIGSYVSYGDSMNLRNILWLAPLPSNTSNDWLAPGVLVVLDAHPGGIIYRDLIPEYVKFARTIYEDDFGDLVVDVNYLNVGGLEPGYQIFIC